MEGSEGDVGDADWPCPNYPLTLSRALKPEAEVDEDGVVMCSGPEEGEVGQVKLCAVGPCGLQVTVARKINSLALLLPQGRRNSLSLQVPALATGQRL